VIPVQELSVELEDSQAKAKELGEDLHKAQELLAGALINRSFIDVIYVSP
jgi:hypothetical protein